MTAAGAAAGAVRTHRGSRLALFHRQQRVEGVENDIASVSRRRRRRVFGAAGVTADRIHHRGPNAATRTTTSAADPAVSRDEPSSFSSVGTLRGSEVLQLRRR